jgi:hypothetical protein
MSFHDEDDGLEPNGNRLDDEALRPAYRRDPDAPSRDRFGPDFDPASLATGEECRAAIAELDDVIALIQAEISPYAHLDRHGLPSLRRDWLHRAGHALKHKHRIRRAIGKRHGELDGHAAGQDQVAVQAAIAERQRIKHQQKLELVAAQNDRRLLEFAAFKRLAKQHFGLDATVALLREAEASVEARIAAEETAG